MTMSNLHPGFILIAVGLIALFVPKSLRRPVLAAGPLLGLGAVLTLAPGTNATLPFINGITLHYLHVAAISSEKKKNVSRLEAIAMPITELIQIAKAAK
jgi:multicomponent Na+:H+ antiporter subunit D